MSKTYRSTKDIAATVRENLKRELPGWKFSVRYRSFSGGSAIDLSLVSGPEEVTIDGKGYAQLNHYSLAKDRLNNGCYLSHAGWSVMTKATEILSREHWDESDIQSDYFCCSFYMHIEIGRWDKPFQVVKP